MSKAVLDGIFSDLRRLVAVYRRGWSGSEKVGEEPKVAVVLGTQVLAGGRASRTLEARARHAARLYASGQVDLLIPTGGIGEHPPSEAEVVGRILCSVDVPDAAVVLEDAARNTWESALLVAGIARERGIDRVRVVTDPLHCVRTVEAFEEAGLAARAEPVYGSPMWAGRWARTGQCAREAVALVWYRTRHGVGSRSRR